MFHNEKHFCDLVWYIFYDIFEVLKFKWSSTLFLKGGFLFSVRLKWYSYNRTITNQLTTFSNLLVIYIPTTDNKRQEMILYHLLSGHTQFTHLYFITLSGQSAIYIYISSRRSTFFWNDPYTSPLRNLQLQAITLKSILLNRFSSILFIPNKF